MKTIIFWTRKGARKPKMVGLATAAGSTYTITDYARMARAGDGRLAIVDAPNVEHGRRILAAHKNGQAQNIGHPGIVFDHDRGRILALGVNAIRAISGAEESARLHDTRLAAQGRVRVDQTRALKDDTRVSPKLFDI